ncbi:NUDIX domain-containing protein [Alkalilimnicola ehrlichii]|uniref:NUDIX domain-containing protein n=1 Tax=Alkalilimnicola ehrlichii TaxID=351052 RepID=UPI001C6DDD8C|nr:NUDIX domain-containing protein [Alkalilimnicola ehrlichii]
MRYCPYCQTELIALSLGGAERQACPDQTCGFVYWNNPVPVLAAVVEHEGEVILARNVGWPEKVFGLITGFMEQNESPEVGILREVEEELGLQGRVASFIGNYAFSQKIRLFWHTT